VGRSAPAAVRDDPSGGHSSRMQQNAAWTRGRVTIRRTLKNEFRRLAEYEYRAVPDPADSRRLSAYGDYTGAHASGIGCWHVGHGVSAEFRISFEELATTGGASLKAPYGVEPLQLWLHGLATFLAVGEHPYENSGYLVVWNPHRVGIVRNAAAASAVYCSYLATKCAAEEVGVSSTRRDADSAVAVKQPGGGVSRRATCDLGVEDARQRAKQMIAEGASHRDVCQRLSDAPRPARVAWNHLPWDKAYREPRFRSSVCKWLSKNCRS
jgi:hypothetical protein